MSNSESGNSPRDRLKEERWQVIDDDGGRRTWDGLPISKTPPFGAVIVVYRWSGSEPEFLILHRGQLGPDFEGDWAWGPPSGARQPDESIDRCAQRELREETGFCLDLRPLSIEPLDWVVFLAETASDMKVQLSAEHDQAMWLRLDTALARISPDIVRTQILEAARVLQSDS